MRLCVYVATPLVVVFRFDVGNRFWKILYLCRFILESQWRDHRSVKLISQS